MHHRTKLLLAASMLASSGCVALTEPDDVPQAVVDSPSARTPLRAPLPPLDLQPPPPSSEPPRALELEPEAGAPPIAIALGEPANLDLAIASMKEQGRRQQICLRRGHALDRGFHGQATYEIRVAPDGRVLAATVLASKALSPAVIECMRLVSLDVIYPAPGGNGAVRRLVISEP